MRIALALLFCLTLYGYEFDCNKDAKIVCGETNLTCQIQYHSCCPTALRESDCMMCGGYWIDGACSKYQGEEPFHATALLASVQSGIVPFFTTLTCQVTPAQKAHLYRWDFDGDGNIDKTTQISRVRHLYDRSGTFEAKCAAQSEDGDWSNEVRTTIHALFAYHLTRGWNLLANIFDRALEPTLFKKAIVLWKFKDGHWKFFSHDPQTKAALQQHYEQFSTIYPLEGFWVYANASEDVKIERKMTRQNPLDRIDRSWTLIGSAQKLDLNTLGNWPEKLVLWKWNNGRWQGWSNDPETLRRMRAHDIPIATIIERGEGFWAKKL